VISIGTCVVWCILNDVGNVEFVDKQYVKRIIEDSEYFDNMNQLDLKARNIQSKDEYKDLYINSIGTFTQQQKRDLKHLVRQANKCLRPYTQIYNIPWKFASISVKIDNGFPHTQGDVIFLSNTFFNRKDTLKTLIHEKIHIYQRLYPLQTNEYILNVLNFEIKKIPNEIQTKVRSNPDLNNILYGKGDYVYAQIFKDNPTSLYDSFAAKINTKTLEIMPISSNDILPSYIKVQQIEHPYEIMACHIPNIILDTSSQDAETIKWMKLFM
jgi:hypothetical protein